MSSLEEQQGGFARLLRRLKRSHNQVDKPDLPAYQPAPGDCQCYETPPHLAEYHERVVRINKENPGQHWIVEAGIPYAVGAEELMRELNDV